MCQKLYVHIEIISGINVIGDDGTNFYITTHTNVLSLFNDVFSCIQNVH
jgi:hypothetical protein